MNYFLPIDLANYEGPTVQYGNAPSTYIGHGPGRLDMGFNHYGDNIYSMTDGIVVGYGFYSNGIDSYCHIQTSNSLLGTFYIRYLHGNYKGIVTEGQEVKKGDRIGTIGDHTTGDPHLHIDFQIDPMNYDDSSFLGVLDQNNKTFAFKNKTYKLSDNIDINKIRSWNSQRGDSMDNTNIGYMWLIFAQTPQHLEPSPPKTDERLSILLDDYAIKVLIGLVATECSWDNAAVAQAILIVVRNWWYIDAKGKSEKMQMTKNTLNINNDMGKHLSRFITGDVTPEQFDDWYNMAVNNGYLTKMISTEDGEINTIDFVKLIMNGTHQPFIEQNKNIAYYNNCTYKDTEDLCGFPSKDSRFDDIRVCTIAPFTDPLLGWDYYGAGTDLEKPSTLLF